MQKLFIFLLLFVRCVECMNISCPVDTCLNNSNVSSCVLCNTSAEIGNNIPMICNVSESGIVSCIKMLDSSLHWWDSTLNIGSVLGWIYLGGRALYKSFFTSPREEYMRSCFQKKVLSSEWLSFIITTPSIISIFTNATWGVHLINSLPLAVAGVQFCYDLYKIIHYCRKDHRIKNFMEFVTKIKKDGDEGNTMKDVALYEWACKENQELEQICEDTTEYKTFLGQTKKTLKTVGQNVLDLVGSLMPLVNEEEEEEERMASDISA